MCKDVIEFILNGLRFRKMYDTYEACENRYDAEYYTISKEDFISNFQKFKNENEFGIVEDQSENLQEWEQKWFLVLAEEAEEMERRYSHYTCRFTGTYNECLSRIDSKKVCFDFIA